MIYRIVAVSAPSLFFAGAVNAQLSSSPECARNYTVRLGDTCDKISAELNVSTYVNKLMSVLSDWILIGTNWPS